MAEQRVTFCRICEAYCGLVATVEDGRIAKVRPDPDHPLSRGYACPKGVSFHEVTHDPDRVLHPMKKVDGAWRRIGWKQAIDEIATRLNRIRLRHGPHAIAAYFGNPTAFSYNHRLFAAGWADALGTRNTYGAGSQDSLADFAASKFLYGASFLQPIPDVERTRYALLIGVNPVVSHATLVNIHDTKRRLEAIRARGGRIVVVDPRRTETARIADEHHFIRPDADAFLLLAMIGTILEEKLDATEFLVARTRGMEYVREAVRPVTPEIAAARTGIDAETIRRLAREFAGAEGALCYGRVTCGTFGTLAAWALEVLNVVAGKLDAPGGMLFGEGITDIVEIAIRGGLDHYGRKRSRIGGFPDVLGELPSGVLADEIATPGEGQVRALVVSAGNPVLSIADGGALAEAMGQLECVVSVDFYLNETAALGHFFLPATTFFERADFPLAHANLMSTPYAQWTEAVVPPQGEAKEEWEIFTLLSDAMGLPIMNQRAAKPLRRALALAGRRFTPRILMDAMLRLGPYGDKFLPWRKDGLSLDALAREPHGRLLRPLRAGIFAEKIRTPDGRVHLWNEAIAGEFARFRASIDAPEDAAFPLRLIGRRDARSHNSWMHNAPHMMRGDRCRRLRIHPEDAAALGVADGERVRVRSRAGSLEVEARVTDEVMPGVVSLPHGWGHTYGTGRRVAEEDPGPNCNALVDRRAIEPLAGMAFLNGFPVAVERLGAPAAI